MRSSISLADGPSKVFWLVWSSFDVLDASVLNCEFDIGLYCGICSGFLVEVDDERRFLGTVLLLYKGKSLPNRSMWVQSNKLQCVSIG